MLFRRAPQPPPYDGVEPAPATTVDEHVTKLDTYEDDAEKNAQLPPSAPADEVDIGNVVETAEDLVTRVIALEDDPSLNPWTVRMLFLGIGFSIFGGVLQEIFYFKPQVIYVSQVFLTVLIYPLGQGLAWLIPRRTVVGRFLNPHPFNIKEHAAVTLMASAATQSALSTEALAAQELWYGGYPNHAAAVFVTLSSQLIGFGIAGLLRDVIVRPTKMIWPMTLPITSLLDSLHRDKNLAKARLKIFYIIFFIMLFWTIMPEYIFTVLEGFSIFCLADQHSLVFTNLFGGSAGNEGLGFLSLCFDWNYIAGFGSPFWLPLKTLANSGVGILCCIITFMGVYYSNIWRSLDFPFLSQMLYTSRSNGTFYSLWNQTVYMNPDSTINATKLFEQDDAVPWMTGTYVVYLITSNMGLTAAIVHMCLWHWDDIKAGWAWAAPAKLARLLRPETYLFWRNVETPEQRRERRINDDDLDPHYRLMLANLYNEVPIYWWGLVLVLCFAVGLGCLYAMKATLPWWGFIVANIFTVIFMLFFGAQYGLTGFQFNVQPFFLTLAGYLFPRRPLANMYFNIFTYQSLQQGQVLARDLRLAQNIHLAPRCTFFIQVVGCIVGAVFNYVMMLQIVQNQRPILLSIAGTNIWSGANVQQFNTSAIAFSLASHLFSIGTRYQWVTIAFLVGFAVPLPLWLAHRYTRWSFFAAVNTSIILWYTGNLFVGLNASLFMYYLLGFASQFWVRRYHPVKFNKYNYVVSAALDGGTQICIFILAFAVQGAAGVSYPFPIWAGNPDPTKHNPDYCMVNTATSG